MMKGIAFQLIGSSAALAVMAGMVGMHWWELESADQPGLSPDLQIAAVPEVSRNTMVPVSTGGEEAAPAAQAPTPESVNTATVQALQEVVSILQDMKLENEDLRRQLEEANEDINGLHILQEMRDQDFKPLKLAPTPEGIYDSGNPLLPPKSW